MIDDQRNCQLAALQHQQHLEGEILREQQIQQIHKMRDRQMVSQSQFRRCNGAMIDDVIKVFFLFARLLQFFLYF